MPLNVERLQRFEAGPTEVLYNPQLGLPPDVVGAAMGCEAAYVVEYLRIQAKDPGLPVNILELGTGSGVCEVGALNNVRNLGNISLTGIDIDEAAVELTRLNIERTASRLGGGLPDADIFRADWYDNQTWERLGQKKYQVILFNPPYLRDGEKVRPGYETVPKHTMYAPDDGLSHYRHVLPRLPDLLDAAEGSTLLIRLPVSLRDTDGREKQTEEVAFSTIAAHQDEPWNVVIQTASAVEDMHGVLVSDRNAGLATISRGDGMFHLGSLFRYALAHDLPYIPDSAGELESMLWERQRGAENNIALS